MVESPRARFTAKLAYSAGALSTWDRESPRGRFDSRLMQRGQTTSRINPPPRIKHSLFIDSVTQRGSTRPMAIIPRAVMLGRKKYSPPRSSTKLGRLVQKKGELAGLVSPCMAYFSPSE
jgi:hypothetical protein